MLGTISQALQLERWYKPSTYSKNVFNIVTVPILTKISRFYDLLKYYLRAVRRVEKNLNWKLLIQITRLLSQMHSK